MNAEEACAAAKAVRECPLPLTVSDAIRKAVKLGYKGTRAYVANEDVTETLGALQALGYGASTVGGDTEGRWICIKWDW